MSKIFIVENADASHVKAAIEGLTHVYGKVQRLFTDVHLDLQDKKIWNVLETQTEIDAYLNQMCTVDHTLGTEQHPAARSVIRTHAMYVDDILFVEYSTGSATSLVLFVNQRSVLNGTTALATYQEFVKAMKSFAMYIGETYPNDERLRVLTQAVVNTRVTHNKGENDA